MFKSNKAKFAIGILISIVFLYLVFDQIDLRQAGEALQKANYYYLLPATIFLFLSLWFRAYRWGIFFRPLKVMKLSNLFSALMVGYMGNTIFPFKLGEILRAHSIGKVENFSKVASFATIVVERMLDLIFLLLLLGIALFFQSFDGYGIVKSGGLILFAVVVAGIIFLVFLIVKTDKTLLFYRRITSVFPAKLRDKGEKILISLLSGLLVIKKPEYYLAIAISSIAIWLCYIATMIIFIYAFDLDEKYFNGDFAQITLASITILIMSGLSVSIPASPGYVGTFHLFVMQALIIYNVPNSQAFSFAVILHLFSMAPPAIMGMYYFFKQHISLKEALENKGVLE